MSTSPPSEYQPVPMVRTGSQTQSHSHVGPGTSQTRTASGGRASVTNSPQTSLLSHSPREPFAGLKRLFRRDSSERHDSTDSTPSGAPSSLRTPLQWGSEAEDPPDFVASPERRDSLEETKAPIASTSSKLQPTLPNSDGLVYRFEPRRDTNPKPVAAISLYDNGEAVPFLRCLKRVEDAHRGKQNSMSSSCAADLPVVWTNDDVTVTLKRRDTRGQTSFVAKDSFSFEGREFRPSSTVPQGHLGGVPGAIQTVSVVVQTLFKIPSMAPDADAENQCKIVRLPLYSIADILSRTPGLPVQAETLEAMEPSFKPGEVQYLCKGKDIIDTLYEASDTEGFTGKGMLTISLSIGLEKPRLQNPIPPPQGSTRG